MEEPSAMVNILSMMPGKNKINLMKNIHLYDYGKKEKNNRKLGHITITEDKSCVESGKIDKLRERIYKIKKIIS